MNLQQRYKLDLMRAAPRFSAKSKRTGAPCRAPAVRDSTVCRFHGARGGAPRGAAHGNWKHGNRSVQAIAGRRQLAKLIREARQLARRID